MLPNLQISLFWDIFCSTIIHINVFCCLFSNAKTPRQELLILQVSLNPSMHTCGQQERGNTLCWERMRNLINLIKQTKISYIRSSLIFHRFSCVCYQNGLHRGTLKGMNRLCSIPFARNLHLSILAQSMRNLKALFDYALKGSSVSRLNLISENKYARP